MQQPGADVCRDDAKKQSWNDAARRRQAVPVEPPLSRAREADRSTAGTKSEAEISLPREKPIAQQISARAAGLPMTILKSPHGKENAMPHRAKTGLDHYGGECV